MPKELLRGIDGRGEEKYGFEAKLIKGNKNRYKTGAEESQNIHS